MYRKRYKLRANKYQKSLVQTSYHYTFHLCVFVGFSSCHYSEEIAMPHNFYESSYEMKLFIFLKFLTKQKFKEFILIIEKEPYKNKKSSNKKRKSKPNKPPDQPSNKPKAMEDLEGERKNEQWSLNKWQHGQAGKIQNFRRHSDIQKAIQQKVLNAKH